MKLLRLLIPSILLSSLSQAVPETVLAAEPIFVFSPIVAQAQESEPKSAEDYYNRGVTYERQKNYEAALADFKRAIEINPNYAEAYAHRGLTYEKLGKNDLALADGLNAKQLFQAQGETFSAQIVDILLNRLAAQSQESEPKSAEDYFNQGFTYLQQENYEAALAEFNRAIEINPNYANAYTNRGIIYEQLGKNDLARTDWENAKQLYQVQGNTSLIVIVDGLLNKLP